MPSRAAAPRRRARLLVLDESDLVQCGLRLMLVPQGWVERCLPARDAENAVAIARRYEPHVALVDVALVQRDGPDVLRKLTDAAPALKIVLLGTAESMRPRAISALGAWGYVSKRARAREVVDGVRMVSYGVRPPATSSGGDDLSARQQEVLQMIARGATNREIARTLNVALDTVKTHTRAIYKRLSARNRTQAVQRGRELGLIC